MTKFFFKIRNLINKHRVLKPVSYPFYRIIGIIYLSQIPLNSQFVDTPKFMHCLYGIFIAGGAKIGKNCTFNHQVTCGG
jgi:serine acetyltransferase